MGAEVAAKITEGGSDAPEQSVMLVLTDAQAQKLFWVMKNGEFSLELRPTDDPADSPESAEASKTLLGDGVSSAQLRRLFRGFAVERNTL
jgi:Flp pilus assembly protein CpaB